MNNKELLRKLPKIDEMLKEDIVKKELSSTTRSIVIESLREAIDKFRNDIILGKIKEFNNKDILDCFYKKIQRKKIPKLRKVINATGVILHTNLGRSILCKEAIENVISISGDYNNLEYNIESGDRGSRYSHVEDLIKKITGAEAAVVVNNNAAAVMLILNTFCNNKEVIVSRGQLVEIGGSFRIPDIMKFSGAKLVEVGTTNRTHLYDYENNINENTGMLLKVHTSNFKIMGFTKEIPLEDLVSLGKAYDIPVVEDIGSGVLVDFSKYGFVYEPTVMDSIKKNVDIVTFSGDKMLGGPQAGIIAGKKIYIDKIKKNQLIRALRVDKMTLAALEGTLKCYLDEEYAIKNIPTLYSILTPKEIHKKRAQNLRNKLKNQNVNLEIKIEKDYSIVGGGAMPSEKIDTYVLKLKSDIYSAEEIEKRLRENSVPIITRIYNGEVYMDLRTIFDRDFNLIADSLKKLF
ncbi:L-seryl-tRNA(Sec) selenium transferase [Clostridium sp. USBA 49]|uniref:L-seryl-tRNA(Sec) selenium transferase n=1 Tax=Clostridium TaxID=1485 RepID=UPI00099AEA36|nr:MULTISPECIES: L-seryl-tRNA(Sec) selenium transferase [Clostridium]SKA75468.1 L-seryl-tRNA(Sec) selenium transferase [Clostridium sp. USBA 49]